ncbi:MAG: hypothetical protein K8S27_07450 [Candidatus Omnitrophica bacterium]|nr:hypothetical protein [Candidatus Omnitrophota bacterium]
MLNSLGTHAPLKTFIFLHALVLIGCSSSQYSGKVIAAGSQKYPLSLIEKLYQGDSLPEPSFELSDVGVRTVLDYSRYGRFENPGTIDYKYVVEDEAKLKKDIGAGIFPNEIALKRDPMYQRMAQQGLLKVGHWEVLMDRNKRRAFYVWTFASEDPGVRTYFTGQILEEAGYILPALKAYYAAIVHFPRSVCWAADGSFVWYIAPAAYAKISRICRDYPQLDLDYEDFSFDIKNGKDTNLKNDRIKINPGRFIRTSYSDKINDLIDVSILSVKQKRGRGKVQLVQYENRHWQMLVGGEPFFVRGVTYNPTKVDIGPHTDGNFLDRWMFADQDENGRIDSAYDAWVDVNQNGKKDHDEKAVGDFQLLKEMGVNAIRWYAPNNPVTAYAPDLVNKELFRELHRQFGIYVIVGDFLGAYTIGSGADWHTGTDYTDPAQRKKMKEVVRAKVIDLKDEPFVLMWLLGNENNMPLEDKGVNATRTNAGRYPKAFARFLSEVVEMVHALDPDHPVAIGNIELGLVDAYKEYASNIDVIGMNSYRGADGFGVLWEEAQKLFDRPVLITEYGCDAYAHKKGVDEVGQLRYHQGNYRDIVFHQAGGHYTGNAIGGVIFEYMDEWWKDTWDHPEDRQQTQSQYPFPFPDGYSHEEWFGIVGQGTGDNSPFERHLRQAYFYYKSLVDFSDYPD